MSDVSGSVDGADGLEVASKYIQAPSATVQKMIPSFQPTGDVTFSRDGTALLHARTVNEWRTETTQVFEVSFPDGKLRKWRTVHTKSDVRVGGVTLPSKLKPTTEIWELRHDWTERKVYFGAQESGERGVEHFLQMRGWTGIQTDASTGVIHYRVYPRNTSSTISTERTMTDEGQLNEGGDTQEARYVSEGQGSAAHSHGGGD